MDNNLVGQTIQGRYYVVEQLGRGGVGVTFLAQDRQCFDSECVVKQLKPKTNNAQSLAVARRLFNHEAEIMNLLGHCDQIPRLLAYFEQNNDFFLVQELIQGHDLSEEILPGKPWSEAKTISLLKGVLEVLVIVQEQGVIHRDLKPSNLMRRTSDDQIILIDFGSVKQVSTQVFDEAGQVRLTVAVGTKSYMPMEQMMGLPGYYSDIYALGIIAIEALTGVSPKELKIDDEGEILWRNRLDRKVHYQPLLLDILDHMVRSSYKERYISAEAVLSDLKKLDEEKNNKDKTVIVPKKNKPEPDPLAGLNQPQSNEREAEKSNKYDSPTVITQKPLEVPPETRSKSIPKIVVPMVATILAVFAGVGGWIFLKQQNNEVEVELSQYENLDRGFRVNYPQTWSKQNRDDFFASGVVFFSPSEDNSDPFKERVSVLVEELGSEQSLSDYTEQSVAEIKQLSDPNIEAAIPVTLGADEGRQIVYRGEENGSPVQRMQSWSLKGDRAYVITYTAQPDQYETYLPIVEKIIESFQTIE